jgi:hypothetical protein
MFQEQKEKYLKDKVSDSKESVPVTTRISETFIEIYKNGLPDKN